jgi:AcrR family transcriptional regulator
MTVDRALGANVRKPASADNRPAARRLLDATMEAIDARGEGAVRVQDIVDAAGVPVPILYRHFGNREGLLQAAQLERMVGELDADLAEIRTAFADVHDAAAFRSLFEQMLRRVNAVERRNARWRRVNIVGSTYGRPELAASVDEALRTFVDGMVDVLSGAQRQGWILPDLDLHAFTAWFVGQTLGRVVIELGGTDDTDAAWDAISKAAIDHALFG